MGVTALTPSGAGVSPPSALSLTLTLQIMGLQLLRRRRESVAGPLGELGKHQHQLQHHLRPSHRRGWLGSGEGKLQIWAKLPGGRDKRTWVPLD